MTSVCRERERIRDSTADENIASQVKDALPLDEGIEENLVLRQTWMTRFIESLVLMGVDWLL